MQTAYNVDPPLGVVGAIAESGAKVVRARIAAGVVRPGQYVVLVGLTCGHPTAAPTAQTRGGVAVRNPYKQNNSAFVAGDVIDIVVDGVIWVASENAASVNTPAFVRFTAAGAEELGAFRTDADTADAAHIPGLYFRTAGTSPVKLEVNKSAA
jgi:hypothetical protein